ncbi:MAG: protein kinase [Lachnospiraceae bacterium]|nr:protein kinase [Lachnospiraceae bacterium]
MKKHSDKPQKNELVEDNGTLIVIEEYLQGRTLQELLEERGTFSESEAFSLTFALARIVRYFHHMTPPVIHRDIKPSNLILSPDHILKLVNFNSVRFAIENPSADVPMTVVILLFAVLASILFTTDYLGIQSLFPLTKSTRVVTRVLGIFLYDMLILVAAFVVTGLLSSFV